MSTINRAVEKPVKKVRKLARKKLYDHFLQLLQSGLKGLKWQTIEKERIERC